MAASASADYLIRGPERERRHNEIKDMLFRCDQGGLRQITREGIHEHFIRPRPDLLVHDR
jgi:hypothetical protein